MSSGRKVAVAESLTSGALASRLGAGPDAAAWFFGGVVAYDESVKFDVLGVGRGPVVTPECARQMSEGGAKLLAADIGVGVTGVGGPSPAEGHPAGTAMIAVTVGTDTTVSTHHFDAEPSEVIERVVETALRKLVSRMTGEPR